MLMDLLLCGKESKNSENNTVEDASMFYVQYFVACPVYCSACTVINGASIYPLDLKYKKDKFSGVSERNLARGDACRYYSPRTPSI